MTISGYKKGDAKLPRANEKIDNTHVRLIGDDGELIGKMPLQDAINTAKERGLDVVEVAPDKDAPVCKMMDFGKFKFERQRRDHKNRKKQKVVHLKEIKLRPAISDHDYGVKLKSILKFIEAGDRVKISLRFRGREITHQEIGEALMQRVVDDTTDIAKLESPPKTDGRQIHMLLTPK